MWVCMSPARRSRLVTAGVIVFAVLAAVVARIQLRPYLTTPGGRVSAPQQRQALFDLLQPVALSNCRLERFGEAHDGGYLMCGNLLEDVESGYLRRHFRV